MSMRRTGTEAAATAEQLNPRRWLALGIVLIAVFMQLMDISIVNVAIPSIQRDLDASYSQVQWVLAGYQLAFAVVAAVGLLRESKAEGALRLDPGGVAIASTALLMLVYPLVEGRDLGWP